MVLRSTALQNCGSSSDWDGEPPGGIAWKSNDDYRRIVPVACSGHTVKDPGVEAETPQLEAPPSCRCETAGVWKR